MKKLLLALGVIGVLVFSFCFLNSVNFDVRAAQIISTDTSSNKQLDPLEKFLTVEAALLGVSDNMSLYFKDLYGSREVSVDPTRSWIPASTIKSFVVPEAFRQRTAGLISFDDQVTIDSQNVVPTELETDEFPRLRAGVVVTVGQLIEAMVEQSDNTAYNTLLDVLGRRNINLTLRNLGITETVVGEKLNLDDEQFQVDLNVVGRQPVTTTAKDLAVLFDLMYSHKIPDSEQMLSIFKKQKINNMIPALLPESIEVAHKTGNWAPIYHDGGIVYKPKMPFVLTVFTNSGDPSVVSKLSRVAYFQNAQSVGEDVPATERKTISRSSGPFYLAQDNISSAVLAAQTEEKVPEITAADLGITDRDLQSGTTKSGDIGKALVGPNSPFYGFKRFFEKVKLSLARSEDAKISVYLALSKNRVADFESAVVAGDVKQAKQLLTEAEGHLKSSIISSQNVSAADENILKIKSADDTNFAGLAKIASRLPADKKDLFVDTVYDYISQNKKEVKPILKKSVITSTTSQEPIIGTVSNVSGNTASVKFDDGSTKELVISSSVVSKSYGSDTLDQNVNLKEGNKIAVIGQASKDGKILPKLILKDLPKNVPDKHKGVVLEVDPGKSSLQILENGEQKEVKVSEETKIRSKDTDVSLEGIKAGSQVTVFGTAPAGGSPSAGASGSPKTSAGPQTRGAPKSSSSPAIGSQSVQSKSSTPIKATTVTVVKNSSGASEKKKGEKKPEDKKAVPPKTDVKKTEEKKDTKSSSNK